MAKKHHCNFAKNKLASLESGIQLDMEQELSVQSVPKVVDDNMFDKQPNNDSKDCNSQNNDQNNIDQSGGYMPGQNSIENLFFTEEDLNHEKTKKSFRKYDDALINAALKKNFKNENFEEKNIPHSP